MKSIEPPLPALQSSRLLDRVRERIRYLHYSIRTEQAYVHWVRAFVRFHESMRHPAEMGALGVEAFLSWLANERKVSGFMHKQALSALVFLYGKLLRLDLPWLARHAARGCGSVLGHMTSAGQKPPPQASMPPPVYAVP